MTWGGQNIWLEIPPRKMSGFENDDGLFRLIVWAPSQRITEDRAPRTTFMGVLLEGDHLVMDRQLTCLQTQFK